MLTPEEALLTIADQANTIRVLTELVRDRERQLEELRRASQPPPGHIQSEQSQGGYEAMTSDARQRTDDV